MSTSQVDKGRVIRFRAWDDFGKKMAYPDGHKYVLQFDGTIGEFDESTQKYNTVQWTLLQSTGLHDKNGKEIYEGDVLKFIDHNGATRHIGPVAWGRYQMGDFDIPTWTANNGNWGGIGLFPANFKKPFIDMEVIGTVYQDKHLLK
jgi:uncharacterized phage protein (TIGR01671 family)